MAFGDLFRPKHKHSNPAVRAAFVGELGDDDQTLLQNIARTDKDISVRLLAIDKIVDVEELADLAHREPDTEVGSQARSRAAELLRRQALGDDENAAHEALSQMISLGEDRWLGDVILRAELPAIREQALTAVRDEKVLADIVRRCNDPRMLTRALAKIHDEDVLRGVAMETENREIGQTALDKIHQEDILEAVSSRAKSKWMRSKAAERLRELRPKTPEISDEEKRGRAERMQLLRGLENQATLELSVAETALGQAKNDWAAISQGLAPDLVARFDALVQRIEKRVSVESEKREKARIAAEKAQLHREEQEKLKAERAVQAQAEREARAAEKQKRTAERDAEMAQKREAKEAQRKKVTEEKVAKKEQDRALKKENAAAEVARLTTELSGLLEHKDLGKKALEKSLEAADARLTELGVAKNEEFEGFYEVRRKVVIKVAELREAEDWERFANVPKQEALIEFVETLYKNIENEDKSELSDKLKQVQALWKEVGPAPREKNKQLWERFKAACDQVYDVVKAGRAESEKGFEENLQKKIALCEKAESLKDSDDLDATATEFKRLQEEWKTIGMVPRKEKDVVWKRFRAACDAFFERRRPVVEQAISERADNLTKKKEIVERVEALLHTKDDEWGEAAKKVADARREWRRIGHVPAKEFTPIKERFEKACDAVFAKRDEAATAKKMAQVSAVEEPLAKVEAVLSNNEADRSALVSDLIAARKAWFDLDDDVVSNFPTVWTRLSAATDKLSVEMPDLLKSTELDVDFVKRKKEKLCQKLEELVKAGDKKADVADKSGKDVAAQLKEALAERALGGILVKKEDPAALVAECKEAWRKLPESTGFDGTILEDRFAKACQDALAKTA